MDYYNVELDIHIHMVFLLLPIMLSCWIRDLKYLVPVSLFANFFMTVGIAVTLYYISQELPAPSTRDYIAPWSKIPLFFGTTIYAFEGIGLVSKTSKQRQYGKVHSLSCTLFTVFHSYTETLLTAHFLSQKKVKKKKKNVVY
jgi:proton-coupled amino acid transporter